MNAAVFLDRDDTLIHNDGDLGDPAKVKLVHGAASALASLCGLGYRVVVISNQGGVARGKYGEEDVQAVNERLRELVTAGANGARIERFYYCPYHPEGSVPDYAREHPDRKPQPGMLLRAAEELGLELSQSWTIGDQLRDVEAGRAAGTRTVLVAPPGGPLPQIDEDTPVRPDFIARTLIEAVRIVAQQRKPEAADSLHSRNKRWDAAAVAELQQESHAPPKPADEQPPEPTPEPEPTPPVDEPAPAQQQPAEAPAVTTAPEAERWTPHSYEDLEESNTISTSPLETHDPEVNDEPAASTPAPEPVQPKPSEPVQGKAAQSDETDRLLHQILQELRNQRGRGEEFALGHVLALLLQVVAAICLLGALWMGAGDETVFWRWLGAGLLAQGAAITALLFHR